jgi:2-keto-4-pentenoate hydratase/2-oxohepta-3-ene-1,7-dioic acid hydratase in catechol pathway
MKFHVGQFIFQASRIFCIGRNYPEHVHEMQSEIPKKPVIFLKPASSLVPAGGQIRFPWHGKILHHEAEVVILIGKKGRAGSEAEARTYIGGISLGIDLTLRDVQWRLKAKGLPWESAKAFDQSAPVGDFRAYDTAIDLADIDFACRVNDEVRQQGNTGDMIFSIEKLIVALSEIWELLPGDLIYTGTPAGVGLLEPGDAIQAESGLLGTFLWNIV